MTMASEKIIPLNKLKVFYFFAHSLENLERECIASNASFKVHIITEHKETQEKRTIGELELLLKDLMTPNSVKKDFYKFFHVEKVAYGWGLEGSIGIIPSASQVSTAKVSFDKTEGHIYIPNENYYFCEPLAEEWIDLIKNKNQQVNNRRSMMKLTKMSLFSEKEKRGETLSMGRFSEIGSNLVGGEEEEGNYLNEIC
jgi:hypothetical protein